MTTGDSYLSTDNRRTAIVRHEVSDGRWAVDLTEADGMVVMATVPATYFDKGWTRNEKGKT